MSTTIGAKINPKTGPQSLCDTLTTCLFVCLSVYISLPLPDVYLYLLKMNTKYNNIYLINIFHLFVL